jgi:hypothetical protein
MCDYSLMSYRNRLAREGEELLVYRFPSGSIGLVSPVDLRCNKDSEISRWRSLLTELKNFFSVAGNCPAPAVCIPPGARLQLHGVTERMQRAHHVDSEETVVFEQLTAAANTYRDAVRFDNGVRVRLQELPEGLRVTVLSMGGQDVETPEFETEGEVVRHGE